MKTNKLIALTILGLLGISVGLRGQETGPKLDTPPYIFTLLHESSKELKGEKLYDLVSDLIRRALKEAPDSDAPYENYIIVEQEDCWIIALNIRGNGKVVERVNGELVTIVNYGRNFSVVLSKKDLEPLKKHERLLPTWNPTTY